MERAAFLAEDWKKAVKEAKSISYKARLEELNVNVSTKEAWCFVNNVKVKKNKSVEWLNEDNERYLEFLKSQVYYLDEDLIRQRAVGIVNDTLWISFHFEDFSRALKKRKLSAAELDLILKEIELILK